MRIATYIRVSTDDQKTGMQVYRKSVADFCERNEHVVTNVFEEEDVSGGLPLKERPVGRQLYELAVSKQIDGILSDNVSRMFRDMEDGICMANRFREAGIKVFFVDYGAHPIDIETESGFIWFVMQLTMAHLERMKIKKRTKDALRMRRNNGYATSHVPYGFDKEPNTGKLIPVESEMQAVKAIIEFRKIGLWSYEKIADELNLKGIPAKKGGKWDKKTVSNVYKYHTQLKNGSPIN